MYGIRFSRVKVMVGLIPYGGGEDMSESTEMYLITVAQLNEATGTESIPLSQLAKALSIKPVSVHEMVRKIAEQGLVKYTPYKGVTLTEQGERVARNVLRKRRLWQVFLVEKLGMTPADADAFSCQLEHITPDDVAERLAEYLGHPKVSPLGKPIPAPVAEGALPVTRLSSVSAGRSSKVVRVDAEPAVRSFLAEQGIRPGAMVTVLAISEGGTLLIQTESRQSTLAGALADRVAVEDVKLSKDAESQNFHPEEEPMSTEQIPLSQLSTGQQGVIVKINAKGALKRRLLDMGLVSGETIAVKRGAPLGEPVEFSVKGYNLSLRKKEAEQVIVEVKSGQG